MSDQGVKTVTVGNVDLQNFVPLQAIRSLGLLQLTSTSPAVDGQLRGIDLNGEVIGGSGQGNSETIFLEEDEFITEVSGTFSTTIITSLNIVTSFGKSVAGGIISGGDQEFSVSGEQISAMGFFVTSNRIIGIQCHLQPLDTIESAIIEDQALTVLNIIPQFQTVTTFTSSELTKLNAASQLQDKQFSSSVKGRVDASARVGFAFASAKFSTSVSKTSKSKSLDRTTLTTELENNEVTSEQVTISIPEGFVGLEVVESQRLRESDGFEWLYPIGSPQIITVPIEEALANERFYDATGVLRTMLPAIDGERRISDTPFPLYEPGEPIEIAARKIDSVQSSVGVGVLGGICAILVALVVALVVRTRKAERRTSVVEDILQTSTEQSTSNPMRKGPAAPPGLQNGENP